MTPNNTLTPPLLRPLNPSEHRETKQLNDALTQAKMQLGDRHAELRMMRVAVEVLTGRALKAEADAAALETESKSLRIAITATTSRAEKAEARVKEQQVELGEQEVDKMALLLEMQGLRNAKFKLEKEADKNYNGYRFS